MNKKLKTKLNKFLKFFTENKHLVGLDNYMIVLNGKFFIKNKTVMAEVDADIFEKELYIKLNEIFLTNQLTKEKINNILMHELVHARYRVFELLCEQQTKFLEEDMINDLTNGLVR
jgi:hypothetical protein